LAFSITRASLKMDEVVDVRVCEHGDNVDVWLSHTVEQPTSWRRTSGCTGGVNGGGFAASRIGLIA